MKGWILLENGKEVITSDNSVEVFLTKKDLLECYNGALGEANTIQRVRLEKEHSTPINKVLYDVWDNKEDDNWVEELGKDLEKEE